MTDHPISAPGAGIGRSLRVGLLVRRMMGTAGPVLAVVAGLLAIWYLAAIPMNAAQSVTDAERAGAAFDVSAAERRDMGGLSLVALAPGTALAGAYGQERPRLPAPHQVAGEMWASTFALGADCGPAERERDRLELFGRTWAVHEDCLAPVTSRRSLILHAGLTLAPTLLGFAIGSLLGVALAVGIVHSRVMDLSVMPWAIASQTIPILAIAPMIIVVMNSVGIQGLLPKAIISAYLSFFPVVVGMAKGLRAPSAADLDLMRTWGASGARILWHLRLPASAPYLFASLKIGVAAALVGAIVAELPTGAVRGLGARLLAGSYYGQTIQIWSALFAAAIAAALLVAAIGGIERGVLGRMGLRR